MTDAGGIRRVYLDTNIFIRWWEGDSSTRQALTDMIVAHPPGREPFFATSELTFAELMVKPYQDRNEELLRIYDNWTVSNEALHVRAVDRGVLYYAAVIRGESHSLKLPDAIHLSSAIGCGCSHFLTDDRGFSDAYTLHHHRNEWMRGPAEVRIIRPDAATLQSIVEALTK